MDIRAIIQIKKNISTKSLLELIQTKQKIIIASYSSNTKTKVADAWLISSEIGEVLVYGYHLIFSHFIDNPSYKPEVFDVPTALLFLNTYCD